MSAADRVDELASEIRNRTVRARTPVVTAIDGRSGAGKSTLAASLAKRLNASVVAGDDFFAGGVTLRQDEPWVLADVCIDWRSLRQVVGKLRRREPARFQPFDWTAFDGSRRSDPVIVEARLVVIVEGVYSARPELREFIDLSVLVDTPDDVRMRRLIEREGEVGAWERQWHLAEDWYFQNRARRENFDIVIDAS